MLKVLSTVTISFEPSHSVIILSIAIRLHSTDTSFLIVVGVHTTKSL